MKLEPMKPIPPVTSSPMRTTTNGGYLPRPGGGVTKEVGADGTPHAYQVTYASPRAHVSAILSRIRHRRQPAIVHSGGRGRGRAPRPDRGIEESFEPSLRAPGDRPDARTASSRDGPRADLGENGETARGVVG